jgi:hypothetical protein
MNYPHIAILEKDYLLLHDIAILQVLLSFHNSVYYFEDEMKTGTFRGLFKPDMLITEDAANNYCKGYNLQQCRKRNS